MCPGCRHEFRFDVGSATAATCPGCARRYRRDDGIWRFLEPGGVARYAEFLSGYAAVRASEGRGADDASYYLALPHRDLTGRHASEWRIRARSYATLIDRVVAPLEAEADRPLGILDLGAGNGWLSYRLVARGHVVAAVDLSDDPRDGLGAHRHYPDDPRYGCFTAVQADFDRLPFAAGSADLVIYNGSLHYSVDYEQTLREALRVLASDGRICVLDSPVYRRAASGRRMQEERSARFWRQHGIRPGSLSSEGFLTPDRLDELGRRLSLDWDAIDPGYGARWVIHRWIGRVRVRRETAAFRVLVATASPGSRRTATIRHRPRGPVASDSPYLVLHPPGGPVAAGWNVLRRMRFLLLQRGRLRRPVQERVAGLPIRVEPGVFHPVLFGTGEFLASAMARIRLPTPARVLELGCGAGAASIVLARRGAEVVAVDVDPRAVRCARANAVMNGVDARMRVVEGDLFAPVAGERFDVIVFNPPFFAGEPTDRGELAFRAGTIPERFAMGLVEHLAPDGRAFLVLSSDGGQAERFLYALAARDLRITEVENRRMTSEVLGLYQVTPRGEEVAR